MSIVAHHERGAASIALAPFAFAWSSWRHLRPRHWAIASSIALAMVAFGAITTIEQSMKMDWDATLIVQVIGPMFSTLLFFLAWAVADAGDDAKMPRLARVTIALLVAAVASAVVTHSVAREIGYFDAITQYFASMKRTVPGPGVLLAVEVLNSLILAGMIVAVIEANRHRMRTQRAVEDAAREQATLARQLLESRLSAMQAQVEPQFLFDSLIDVQALYDRDTQHGAGILDRLIAYLRVALPRLRESGSSVQAEVELVRAYLDVVAARYDGRPAVAIRVDPQLEGERFYPMLMLPLIQRAIRSARDKHAAPPARIELNIARDAPNGSDAALLVTLRIQAPGLCVEDADLARVRERLDGLTEGRAQLLCEEFEPAGITVFTLRLPINAPANTDPANTATR